MADGATPRSTLDGVSHNRRTREMLCGWTCGPRKCPDLVLTECNMITQHMSKCAAESCANARMCPSQQFFTKCAVVCPLCGVCTSHWSIRFPQICKQKLAKNQTFILFSFFFVFTFRKIISCTNPKKSCGLIRFPTTTAASGAAPLGQNHKFCDETLHVQQAANRFGRCFACGQIMV
jgi:hypothetical protein